MAYTNIDSIGVAGLRKELGADGTEVVTISRADHDALHNRIIELNEELETLRSTTNYSVLRLATSVIDNMHPNEYTHEEFSAYTRLIEAVQADLSRYTDEDVDDVFTRGLEAMESSRGMYEDDKDESLAESEVDGDDGEVTADSDVQVITTTEFIDRYSVQSLESVIEGAHGHDCLVDVQLAIRTFYSTVRETGIVSYEDNYYVYNKFEYDALHTPRLILPGPSEHSAGINAWFENNGGSNGVVRLSDMAGYDPELASKYTTNWVTGGCVHEYVNVGFSTVRLVCKHCNHEQQGG